MTNKKNEDDECFICLDNKIDLIELHNGMHPCCKVCAIEIINKNNSLDCPLCRKKILNHNDKEINDLILTAELTKYPKYIENISNNFPSHEIIFDYDNSINYNTYYNTNTIIIEKGWFTIFSYIKMYYTNDLNNLKKDIFQKYKNPRKSYKPVGGKCVKFKYI